MEALEYVKKRREELKYKPPTKVKNVKEAIELAKKFNKFYIIADYDCDGVCAGASAYFLLKEFEKEVTVRFPKRFSEGYGLSIKIVDEIIENIDKDTLICTVDNGIAAFNAIKKLKDNGYTVLLTDHHLVPTDDGKPLYPPADVIINESDGFSKGNTPWCGAGLIYTIMRELEVSTQCENNITFLTGLATVGDMVPLINGNRKLVKDSLKIANEMQYLSEGIMALLKHLNIEFITEDTYGFQIAPMINASGRLYDNGAEGVFKILIDKDVERIRQNVQILSAINTKRKDMSYELTNKAKLMITGDEKVIVSSLNVPLGICGLVAGQLTEDYNVPSFVFCETDENTLKGSVRSVEGINIYQRVKNVATAHPELILGYGGHSQAMGIAIKKENFEAFKKAMEEEIVEKMDSKEFKGDASINLGEDLDKLYKELSYLAPFGMGNPAPVFEFKNYALTNPFNKFTIMGKHEEHIKFNNEVVALGFSLADKYKELNYPDKLDLLVTPSVNVFNCKKEVQLMISDLRASA